MKFKNEKLSIREAKQIDMVTYLSKLGYEPLKIRNNDYWYISPLRVEKTSSFKINRSINNRYDHGLGEGGNLIDFAIKYYRCTVSEALQHISQNASVQKPLLAQNSRNANLERHTTILDTSPLSSTALFLRTYNKDRYHLLLRTNSVGRSGMKSMESYTMESGLKMTWEDMKLAVLTLKEAALQRGLARSKITNHRSQYLKDLWISYRFSQ